MQTSKAKKKGQNSTLESQKYGILMNLGVESTAADECWSKVIPIKLLSYRG